MTYYSYQLYCKLLSQYTNKYTNVTKPLTNIHRPSNTDTLASFMELFVFSPVPWASKYHWEKYMGCFGTERNVVSFSNMNTTDDISGLLFGLSCTHKSPMWMHLKASFGKQLSTRDESTKSIALPSIHKLHAWTNSRKIHRISACFVWICKIWRMPLYLHKLIGYESSWSESKWSSDHLWSPTV